MIKYNLKCINNHEFESWFSDSNEFDKLNKKKLLECIYCASNKIKKSIMAPMISGTKSKKDSIHPLNKDLLNKIPDLNWTALSDYEKIDLTISSQELACTGNTCEIL